jgi:hypothetical protein
MPFAKSQVIRGRIVEALTRHGFKYTITIHPECSVVECMPYSFWIDDNVYGEDVVVHVMRIFFPRRSWDPILQCTIPCNDHEGIQAHRIVNTVFPWSIEVEDGI